MFYSANFNTRISFNSVTDLPQVLYNVHYMIAAAITLSLATLVYSDNNQLNLRYVVQVTSASLEVKFRLVLRHH